MVPSEVVAVRGTVLDERLDGDDDFVGAGTGAALRLGNQPVSTSHGDDCRVFGDDVEQHFLGQFKRQIWKEAGRKEVENHHNERLQTSHFQALTLCGILLFLYGLLSAVAPNLSWLLLLRGLVGFAIGAVPQSVTLYAEFLPTKQRAKCVVLLDCFWALGACFEVVLAMAVVPTLGWRWLLGLSAAPLFVFACLTPWIPESARYHVSCGQNDKALTTLEAVSGTFKSF